MLSLSTYRTSPFISTVVLIIAFLVIRLPFAAMLELGADEAHYALYGIYLDWGYYDHPPMVGWLMALSQMLFGQSNLALRVLPLILSSLSLVLVYWWSNQIFNHAHKWLGFWAVLLIELSPLPFIVNMGMIPEIPLVFFSMLSLIAYKKIIDSPNTIIHWLWFGVLMGLAGLSKYTAVLLPAGVLITLIVTKKWALLANWRIGITIIVAVFFITPIFYWNSQHDWISFKYQFDHVSDNGKSLASWDIRIALKTLAAQIISYFPLFIAFVFTLRQWKAEKNIYFTTSIYIFLVLMGVMFYFSGFSFSLPHWSMLAWFVISPITALAIIGIVNNNKKLSLPLIQYSTVLAMFFSVVLLVAIYSHAVYPMPWVSSDKDFITEVRGWEEEAKEIAHVYNQEYPTEVLKANNKIYVHHWTLGSRFAWYLPRNLSDKVIVLSNSISQHSLWFGSPIKGDNDQQEGNQGLLIEWSQSRKDDIHQLAATWQMKCEEKSNKKIVHHHREIAWFKIWKCKSVH